MRIDEQDQLSHQAKKPSHGAPALAVRRIPNPTAFERGQCITSSTSLKMKRIIAALVQCASSNVVPESLKELEHLLGRRSLLDGAFGLVTCLFGLPIRLPYDLNALWPGGSRPPAFNAGIRMLIEASPDCSELFSIVGGILDFDERITSVERQEIIDFVKLEYKPQVYL